MAAEARGYMEDISDSAIGTRSADTEPTVGVGAATIGVRAPAIRVRAPAVGVGAATVSVGASAVGVGASAVGVGAPAHEPLRERFLSPLFLELLLILYFLLVNVRRVSHDDLS
jgi:hypothetical protein